MTIYLPNELKLLIYSYGCKEILIFDIDFYNYIKKLRKEFLFNPLKIKYKIETWEYPLVRCGWSSLPQRYTVINKLNSHTISQLTITSVPSHHCPLLLWSLPFI